MTTNAKKKAAPPARSKGRVRNDTFWSLSSEKTFQIFDSIIKNTHANYKIDKSRMTKTDVDGVERKCWCVVHRTTGKALTTLHSTQPYRLALVWSVSPTHSYWGDPAKTEQIRQAIPTALGKKGNHTRHLCGYDWCCNPCHLRIGTREQNEDDKNFHRFLNSDLRDSFLESEGMKEEVRRLGLF